MMVHFPLTTLLGKHKPIHTNDVLQIFDPKGDPPCGESSICCCFCWQWLCYRLIQDALFPSETPLPLLSMLRPPNPAPLLGLPHMDTGQSTAIIIILTPMFISIPEGNFIFTFMAATGRPLWRFLVNFAFLQENTSTWTWMMTGLIGITPMSKRNIRPAGKRKRKGQKGSDIQ